MSAFPTTGIDAYLSASPAITPMAFLASLQGKAEANFNYPPAPSFVYDTADVTNLLLTSPKFQGVLYPNSDGSAQIGLNYSSFIVVLVDALVALNTDYQAYKTAHP